MFNFGMQPLMWSEKHGQGWKRAGSSIIYFKSGHPRPDSTGHYYSVSFNIVFEHEADLCYLAYHYPYTYTDLQQTLRLITKVAPPFLHRQLLCRTLGGNRCDLLTVTSFDREDLKRNPLCDRPYIIVSGRVHPGESNSSWVMHGKCSSCRAVLCLLWSGFLDFLLSDDTSAMELRRTFIFKVIPMLNPDGVINGHLRCSLSGNDLNRQWYISAEHLVLIDIGSTLTLTSTQQSFTSKPSCTT